MGANSFRLEFAFLTVSPLMERGKVLLLMMAYLAALLDAANPIDIIALIKDVSLANMVFLISLKVSSSC